MNQELRKLLPSLDDRLPPPLTRRTANGTLELGYLLKGCGGTVAYVSLKDAIEVEAHHTKAHETVTPLGLTTPVLVSRFDSEITDGRIPLGGALFVLQNNSTVMLSIEDAVKVRKFLGETR